MARSNSRRRRRRGSGDTNTANPVGASTSVKQRVLDEIKHGGKVVKDNEAGGSINDDDLRIAIKSTEIALAYLEGRGRTFDLASAALRRDLSMLEQYRDMRKHHK
jgi:hypothetical protein